MGLHKRGWRDKTPKVCSTKASCSGRVSVWCGRTSRREKECVCRLFVWHAAREAAAQGGCSREKRAEQSRAGDLGRSGWRCHRQQEGEASLLGGQNCRVRRVATTGNWMKGTGAGGAQVQKGERGQRYWNHPALGMRGQCSGVCGAWWCHSLQAQRFVCDGGLETSHTRRATDVPDAGRDDETGEQVTWSGRGNLPTSVVASAGAST